MRLFKYLLIDDSLMHSGELFGVFLLKREYHRRENQLLTSRTRQVATHYVNQFYEIQPTKQFPLTGEIMFMSIPYPNTAEHQSAYVLIDKEQFDPVLQEIIGPYHRNGNVIRFQTKKKQKYSSGWRYVNPVKTKKTIDMDGSRRFIESVLGRAVTQNEFNLLIKEKTYSKKVSLEINGHVYHRRNTTPNTFFSLSDVICFGSAPHINQCVHHLGHTFDNRKEFLKITSPEEHDRIHAETELAHDIFRSKHICGGDCFTLVQDCTCENKNCDECCGVLKIETIDQLEQFLQNLFSTEYKNLKL